MNGRAEMNLKQRFDEPGQVGRAVINLDDKSRERDRSPMRSLASVALLAVIAAAACSNDVPEAAGAVAESAGGDPSDCYTTVTASSCPSDAPAAAEAAGQSAGGGSSYCYTTTDQRRCPVPVAESAGGDPSDCYTTDADLPQHPRDTNRYVVALTDDANAGTLDGYAHCKHLPAINPRSADPDCYSKGDDNAWHLRGVNLYALALLKGGASAGALDEYAACAFMPAVLTGTSGG